MKKRSAKSTKDSKKQIANDPGKLLDLIALSAQKKKLDAKAKHDIQSFREEAAELKRTSDLLNAQSEAIEKTAEQDNERFKELADRVGLDTLKDYFCDEYIKRKCTFTLLDLIPHPCNCPNFQAFMDKYRKAHSELSVKFIYQHLGDVCEHCTEPTNFKLLYDIDDNRDTHLEMTQKVFDRALKKFESNNGEKVGKQFECSVCGTFTRMMCPGCALVRFCQLCWTHKYKDHMKICKVVIDDNNTSSTDNVISRVSVISSTNIDRSNDNNKPNDNNQPNDNNRQTDNNKPNNNNKPNDDNSVVGAKVLSELIKTFKLNSMLGINQQSLRSNQAEQLSDIALLSLTKNMNTLGDIIDYCRKSDSGYRVEKFWKITLTRLFDRYFVVQREDLTDADWYQFALLLKEGLTFKYCMKVECINDVWTGPFSYHNVYNGAHKPTENEEYGYRQFDILGMRPTPGTRGYFVHIDIHNSRKTVNNFFVSPDNKRAYLNVLKYIAHVFRDYYTGSNPHYSNYGFDFFDDDHLRDDGRRLEFPSEDELYEILKSYKIDSKNGTTVIPIWNVLYGPYKKGVESEFATSNFEVVPITF